MTMALPRCKRHGEDHTGKGDTLLPVTGWPGEQGIRPSFSVEERAARNTGPFICQLDCMVRWGWSNAESLEGPRYFGSACRPLIGDMAGQIRSLRRRRSRGRSPDEGEVDIVSRAGVDCCPQSEWMRRKIAAEFVHSVRVDDDGIVRT